MEKTAKFSDILARRLQRRSVLQSLVGFSALAIIPLPLHHSFATTTAFSPFHALGATPLDPIHSDNPSLQLAEGYQWQTLVQWGDALTNNLAPFKPQKLTPTEQTKRIGMNTDFTAFMPLPKGSTNSDHGLLCINHESASAHDMLPDYNPKHHTAMHTALEQAAMGMSIVEIKYHNDVWEIVKDSSYNRRITTNNTSMRLRGAATGHPSMCTTKSPKGTFVRGMIGNCAGGITPWGTVLTCEENFNDYFGGKQPSPQLQREYARYGITAKPKTQWYKTSPRFNVGLQPNEPNRFGWIVEIDPYNPKSIPIKRTSLGRFKHETATCVISADGRLVVYSGDDEIFQYLYKFITHQPVNTTNLEENRHLLDKGILYVAQFNDDGAMQWLPLVHGKGKLTPKNGFHSQADVVIHARHAATLMGATPMDRPEGIAIHPVDGRVYVSLTNNKKRETPNIANPRIANIHGHILELIPPMLGDKIDHTALSHPWEIFLLGHAPHLKTPPIQGPLLRHSTTTWLSCPDNLTFDADGNLWVATDGQPKTTGMCDSLYIVETNQFRRGIPRRFLNAPKGAEVTGPSFTPDGSTLFLSLQHPENDENKPFSARSSVIAIRKQ